MSCLCNQTCSVEIINQLTEFAAALTRLEACLADIAAKVARIDVYDDDWEDEGDDGEEDDAGSFGDDL